MPAEPISLTVLLCTYNEELWVEKTLLSLKSQRTATAYEIVAVDNGSSDRTREILDGYADLVVHCRERGKVPCMRVGVRNARGSIVAMVDADTIYPDDWLDRVVSAFNDTSILLVWGRGYAGSRPSALGDALVRAFAAISIACGVGSAVGYNMAARCEALTAALDAIDNVALSSWGIGTAVVRAHGRGAVRFEPMMRAPKCLRRVDRRGWWWALSLWGGEWLRLARGRDLSVSESAYYEF